MPGFDQNLSIPLQHEPPRTDADDTLPNMIHPSHPYGRGPSVGQVLRGGGLSGVAGVSGVEGPLASGELHNGPGGSSEQQRGNVARLFGGKGQIGGRQRERWVEFGLEGMLEREQRKEMPPGMAVSLPLFSVCDSCTLHSLRGCAERC